MGGDDGMKTSTGIHGLKGNMNAPTVFNSVFNFTQFWNGRAKNLSHQASGPLHNPVEMGMDSKTIIQRLTANKYYQKSFASLTHRNTILFSDVVNAISEFEKTLITPNSKFDRYLRKEITLSDSELNGYSHFKQLGCIVCHNGVNVGGNSFQKFGAIIPISHTIMSQIDMYH
jgi:cytochrome c peroxidase